MRFIDWLKVRQEGTSQFCDLARDAAQDVRFPRDGTSLTRLLDHIGTFGPARRMLRRAWVTYRAETEQGIDELAGVLMLDDRELAIVTDCLESYQRRERDDDEDFETETDERVERLLQKIGQA